MRGTGQFEIARSVIITKANRPFSIVFFGDVHYGTKSHAEAEFNEFCEEYKNRPDTYFIGMGDYLDRFSASERMSWKHGEWHESTDESVEEWHQHTLAEFAEKIKWMRGRLLGMLEGNHHIRFSDGTTTAMRLCADLGAQYLGDCALLHVGVHDAHPNGSRMSFDIALHHGVGGGRTSGAMFNSLDHMATAFEGYSIYAMGDNHQRGGLPIERLYLSASHSQVRIKSRKIYLIRTGSFQRGYVPGRRSYVIDKMMRPTNLGSVRVDVTMKRVRKGRNGVHGGDYSLDLTCSV